MMKVLLVILGLSLPVSAGQLSTNYPGLVCLWHMNEATGTVAKNQIPSTACNDGAVSSMGWVSGLYGSSLVSAGTDSHVRLAANTAIPNGTSPRTFMFWVRRTSLAAFIQDSEWLYFCGSDASGDWGWALYLKNVAGLVTFYGAGAGNFDTTMYISDLKWHHIAVSLSTDLQVRTYKDGVMYDAISRTSLNTHNDTPFTIGDYWRSAPSYNLRGAFDDFAIFNRQLSTGEIQRIYVEGLGRHSNVR